MGDINTKMARAGITRRACLQSASAVLLAGAGAGGAADFRRVDALPADRGRRHAQALAQNVTQRGRRAGVTAAGRPRPGARHRTGGTWHRRAAGQRQADRLRGAGDAA